ncbi:MAG: arginine--tRNA ligase [Nanoarchaeota archaeon]|nr:arginine--tRNA ligase [Nanoarchaeota archaeon]
MQFEKEVERALKKVGIKKIKLEKPPNPKFGDISFPCFELAKGKNPTEVAKEIAEKIKPKGLIAKVEAVGPYVNFFINNEKFCKEAIKQMIKKDFGKGKKKGKALVEHTSINPNASPHVGRARNAIIGDCIVRVLKFYGYDVETHYFVNDVGKQIAMLVLAAKKKKKISFDELLDMYIKINAELISNASLEKEVFELLKKLENGDEKTIKLFEKVCKIAINGQTKILNELGIKYDYFDFESKYIKSKKLKEIIEKLKKKRKIKKAKDGRLLVDLSNYNLPMREPYVAITRANGTSLYILRDIAYTIDKVKRAKKNVVVLGEDHKLYFQQIKAILDMLGYKAPEVVHYSFVLLQTGKMSTRKGNIVLLTDFMKEAREKAKNEIIKRNPNIDEKELEKLSKIIGYGALKYSILRVSPDKNVVFSWDEALNFEGESAPYIQYTYVRAKRILEKAKKVKAGKIKFQSKHEIKLIKKMFEFPTIVENISKEYNIHALAKYAYDLANLFNNFYENVNVIKEEDKDKRYSRTLLLKAYMNLIEKVLSLLGINTPSFM